MVVLTSRWPRSSWTVRMSWPRSRRCVARSVGRCGRSLVCRGLRPAQRSLRHAAPRSREDDAGAPYLSILCSVRSPERPIATPTSARRSEFFARWPRVARRTRTRSAGPSGEPSGRARIDVATAEPPSAAACCAVPTTLATLEIDALHMQHQPFQQAQTKAVQEQRNQMHRPGQTTEHLPGLRPSLTRHAAAQDGLVVQHHSARATDFQHMSIQKQQSSQGLILSGSADAQDARSPFVGKKMKRLIRNGDCASPDERELTSRRARFGFCVPKRRLGPPHSKTLRAALAGRPTQTYST
jgi:hypothetical protein